LNFQEDHFVDRRDHSAKKRSRKRKLKVNNTEFDKLLSKAWDKSDIDPKKCSNLNSGQSFDPRPDLTHDSILWWQMLVAALDRDPSGELYAALLYMRTRGTVLRRVRNKEGKYVRVLRPWIDPTGRDGWANIGEYETEKHKVLDPVRDRLIELLKVM
jgi:hypothetical protein